ncbi:hypothetical protein OG407_14950 [Streptomyces sp. NBC_01515]|uniref:alkyl sulfatase dimerization domain-containing protein n=1 Tax=Streptomyces sp. NBC_01515 TaxID=2903890 RepID=UPI003869EAAC
MWANRGYHGPVSHNPKGNWQRYTGWFDANSARLEHRNSSVAAIPVSPPLSSAVAHSPNPTRSSQSSRRRRYLRPTSGCRPRLRGGRGRGSSSRPLRGASRP